MTDKNDKNEEKALHDFLTYKALHEYKLRQENKLKHLEKEGAEPERKTLVKKIIKNVEKKINNI